MSEALSTAFLVLAVGMITVFVILSLVVLSGNALIHFINKYFPENTKIIAPRTVSTSNEDGITKSKMAAIVTAVDITTQGRGRVAKIEKIT